MRATATEAALVGRPWNAETVREAAAVLRDEGTPIDDHRASAAYRTAMLGQSLLKFMRERGGVGMSELSLRPASPSSGVSMPHESADLHVTGPALYTDDLVTATPACCTPSRSRRRTPTRAITALRTEPALRRARGGAGAHRGRRPGRERRRASSTTSRCSRAR